MGWGRANFLSKNRIVEYCRNEALPPLPPLAATTSRWEQGQGLRVKRKHLEIRLLCSTSTDFYFEEVASLSNTGQENTPQDSDMIYSCVELSCSLGSTLTRIFLKRLQHNCKLRALILSAAKM